MITKIQRLVYDLSRWSLTVDGYQGLLEILGPFFQYDAAVLFSHKRGVLKPRASIGLPPESLGFEYPISEHPRLKIIARGRAPHLFPSRCTLADPFDGMLEEALGTGERVHSCMGFPLRHKGELVGLLTLDSLKIDQFTSFSKEQRVLFCGLLSRSLVHEEERKLCIENNSAPKGVLSEGIMDSPKERQMVGEHPSLRSLRKEIALVAPSMLTILILGETGVGKELVAQDVHKLSPRNEKVLIYVNCAALPLQLIESELFGHAKGAFTGAEGVRLGKFESADGGTLFLDEIGELPLNAQSKLLRVLQEGEVQRVGSDIMRTVDVRIIAATNRNLEEEVAQGRFRSDLYHRLMEYPLTVPPLKDRGGDVILLAGHFATRAARKYGLSRVVFSGETRRQLQEYEWKGNIRELKNVVKRAVLRASRRALPGELHTIVSDDLQLSPATSASPAVLPVIPAEDSRNLKDRLIQYQRQVISETVNHCRGNWAEAGRILGMHRSNLHRLAKRLEIL